MKSIQLVSGFKNSWYIHTMGYYLAIKRIKLLIHTTWMNLRSKMLSDNKADLLFRKITQDMATPCQISLKIHTIMKNKLYTYTLLLLKCCHTNMKNKCLYELHILLFILLHKCHYLSQAFNSVN